MPEKLLQEFAHKPDGYRAQLVSIITEIKLLPDKAPMLSEAAGLLLPLVQSAAKCDCLSSAHRAVCQNTLSTDTDRNATRGDVLRLRRSWAVQFFQDSPPRESKVLLRFAHFTA